MTFPTKSRSERFPLVLSTFPFNTPLRRTWRTRVAVSLLAILCVTTRADSAEPEPTPWLHLSETVVDFGQVESSKSLHRSILLKNTGRRTLVIDALKVACTCTTASLSSFTIHPDESVELSVDVSLYLYPGDRLSTHVEIVSDDPVLRTSTVFLRAEILPEFVLERVRLDFGKVKQGHAQALEVIVLPKYGPSPTIEVIEAPEHVRARVISASSDVDPDDSASSHVRKILVELEGTAGIRRVAGNVVLATNIPRLPRISLPVSAALIGVEYTVTPRVMLLGNVAPGGIGSPITIVGKHDLEILSIKSDIPDIRFEAELGESPRHHIVRPHVSPEAELGVLRGTLTVELKEGNLVETCQIGVFGIADDESD